MTCPSAGKMKQAEYSKSEKNKIVDDWLGLCKLKLRKYQKIEAKPEIWKID